MEKKYVMTSYTRSLTCFLNVLIRNYYVRLRTNLKKSENKNDMLASRQKGHSYNFIAPSEHTGKVLRFRSRQKHHRFIDNLFIFAGLLRLWKNSRAQFQVKPTCIHLNLIFVENFTENLTRKTIKKSMPFTGHNEMS